MAFVPFYSQFPMSNPPFASPLALATTLLIDATGEKVAILGYPYLRDIGKSLTKVGFRFGAVTKAGGSVLTVSHQDVSLTAGPPGQPDGTPDGSVAIANANGAFLSNTWIQTAAFDTPRTITGAPFAIVIEYDGAGRLGADSVVVSSTTSSTTNAKNSVGSPSLNTGGVWTIIDAVQNILFEFTDGSFGTFIDSYPYQTITATAYNSGSAADEFALEFTVPASVQVEGAWILAMLAAGADADIVLYNGTSAMATVSIDANTPVSNAAPRPIRVCFATAQQLDAGNTYRLALKPTTTNNVTVYDLTVNAAAHLQAWDGGTAYYLATRVDAGAWTSLTTRRPLMGLNLAAISDGAGAGGGGGGGGNSRWWTV